MKTNIQDCNFSSLGEELSAIDTDNLLIVVDSRVWQIYSKELVRNHPKDKKIYLYKTLEGEATKNIAEFEKGLEFFLEKWSVVPTTLLSMVDASIGGKTGINSKHGKNLIGAFHLPENVWIIEDFINSLPKEELDSGLGEIIKYGFLDKGVSKLLTSKCSLSEVIEACARKKEEVVQSDFKENGERISLNLGHTFGHALERIYDLPHGVAVFWGMALIFKLYEGEIFLESLRLFETSLGADFGAPPWLNKTFPVKKIMEYVTKDKKRKSNEELQLVLVEEIGQFKAVNFKISDIEKRLEQSKDDLRSFNF
jgi:3-dehydroquinate synthase